MPPLDIDRLILAPCLEIFGDGDAALTYAPASGASSFTVNGVFDEGYEDANPTPDIGVTSAGPDVGVREADFTNQGRPLPVQGDQITRQKNGNQYVVKDVQPDSHGWIYLPLNKLGYGT